MKISELLVLAIGGTLAATTAAHAQDSAPPELLYIEVVSAEIPAARSARDTWDPTTEASENLFCVLGSLAAGASSGPAAGAVASRVCNALTPTADEHARPSDPDAYVELDFGRNRPRMRTPVMPDSAHPIWAYGFYAYSTDLPATFLANLIDADPGNRSDPIADVVLRRDELLVAARDEAIVDAQSASGVGLRLRVTNVSSNIDAESRRWSFEVPAASEWTHAPLQDGERIPAGARVRVRTVGSVQLGDPRRFPALGPEGSPDVASRRSNLPEFPSEPFGALMMVLGSDAAARQSVAVGRCVEFVAKQSGIPTFIINDDSRRSNAGSFRVSLTIDPPRPGESMRPVGVPVPCTPDEDVAAAATPADAPNSPAEATHRLGRLEIQAPPTKTNGAPWDGDNSAPDLVVVVTQNRQELLRSPLAQNAWQVALDLIVMDPSAGPLLVAVIDKDVISDDRVGEVLLDLDAGMTTGALGAGGSVAFVGE